MNAVMFDVVYISFESASKKGPHVVIDYYYGNFLKYLLKCDLGTENCRQLAGCSQSKHTGNQLLDGETEPSWSPQPQGLAFILIL